MTTVLLTPPTAEPVVDDATRREFLAGLAAAGLLAGCATGPQPDPASPDAGAGFPRTVDNVLGPTEIPRAPERVAALDAHSLVDTVVALGLTPTVTLGVPPWIEGRIDPSLAEGTEQTAFVNLEALAAARPDLIIGFEYQADIGGQLQQIAPTVLIPDTVEGPNAYTAFVAEATGRETVADELAERYRARTEQVRSGAGATAPAVSIIRPQVDSFIAYNATSDAGGVLADCGVTVADPPPGEMFGTGIANRCSLELIGEIAGEVIYVISYDVEDAEFASLYAGNPLWQQLPAVQAGRVVPVQGLAWTNFGPLGALELIDELETGLSA